MKATVPLGHNGSTSIEVETAVVRQAGSDAGDIELAVSAPDTDPETVSKHLFVAVPGERYRRPAAETRAEDDHVAITYHAPPFGDRVTTPDDVEVIWIARPERNLGKIPLDRANGD